MIKRDCVLNASLLQNIFCSNNSTLPIRKFKTDTYCSKKYNRLKDDVQRAQHMSTIQRIQRSIEAWEGKDIGFKCAEFIREGSLHMFHRTHSMKDTIRGKSWSERHLFLFDHLLVITKQLKSGSSYKYKQQISVQCCDIFDLPDDDGKDIVFYI